MDIAALDNFLKIIADKFYLKEFLTPDDLISIGIFENRKQFTWWRRQYNDLPIVKVSDKRFVLPKKLLINWFKLRNEEGNL